MTPTATQQQIDRRFAQTIVVLNAWTVAFWVGLHCNPWIGSVQTALPVNLLTFFCGTTVPPIGLLCGAIGIFAMQGSTRYWWFACLVTSMIAATTNLAVFVVHIAPAC